MLKVGDIRHRRRLIELEMRRLGDLERGGFRYALDIDRGARGSRAFGLGLGHLFDVAIRGIVEHENFRHFGLLKADRASDALLVFQKRVETIG